MSRFVREHSFAGSGASVGRVPTPTPFPVGDVNSYLLLPGRDGSLTLVDTGVHSEDAFEALRAGFKEFGLDLGQIDRILVTHAHPDHFGQAARLVEASGACVHASAVEAERMETAFSLRSHFRDHARPLFRWLGVPEERLGGRGDAGSDPSRAFIEPVPVDVVVRDGDRIDTGDLTLEVVETPGHTEGHVVYLAREEKLLFAGDHLLPDITPVPLLHVPAEGAPRERSLLRFLASLERCEALECDLVFPSHGDVVRDHRALIRSYRLHADRRALQIARRLRGGPLTPFEIGRRMFKRFIETELFLVISEVIGHLDLLESRGQVVYEEEGGVLQVRLAEDTEEDAVWASPRSTS